MSNDISFNTQVQTHEMTEEEFQSECRTLGNTLHEAFVKNGPPHFHVMVATLLGLLDSLIDSCPSKEIKKTIIKNTGMMLADACENNKIDLDEIEEEIDEEVEHRRGPLN